MDNRERRWGQLGEYSGNPVYDVDHRYLDSEEPTKSWLVWDPPQDISEEERPEEIHWANVCQQLHRFDTWEGFETRTIGVESFVPVNYYGLTEERRDRLGSTLTDVAHDFGIDRNSPTPPAKIHGAIAIRDEARDRLEVHVKRLKEKVMKPLRNVFIACAVEATRATTGFSDEPEDDALDKWIESIADLDHLFSTGIGRGIQFTKLLEEWYEGTFEHVPDPVAEGVRAALSVYVERSAHKVRYRSRDGILENARPVYFKWEAARRIVWSGLYDWNLNEVAERAKLGAPSTRGEEYLRAVLEVKSEVFNGLSDWCTAVVKRCPKPNGEIPNWRAFRDWLVRNGLYESHGSYESARQKAEDWARDVHGSKE